jgi:outer membrane murein-binding lipoprotein Lpp
MPCFRTLIYLALILGGILPAAAQESFTEAMDETRAAVRAVRDRMQQLNRELEQAKKDLQARQQETANLQAEVRRQARRLREMESSSRWAQTLLIALGLATVAALGAAMLRRGGSLPVRGPGPLPDAETLRPLQEQVSAADARLRALEQEVRR